MCDSLESSLSVNKLGKKLTQKEYHDLLIFFKIIHPRGWGVALIQTTRLPLSFGISSEGKTTDNTGETYVQTNFWTHVTCQNARKYKKEIHDRPLVSNDSESVIKFTNHEKKPGTRRGCTVKCNQTFKEITLVFPKQILYN